MDLIQIVEMKNKVTEELRQIDELKQSMEKTLAGLIQWEKSLQAGATGPSKTTTRRPAVVKEVQPKPQVPIKHANATPGERVNKALSNMRGEFTRSQLLAEVEGDGKGDIGGGTFNTIFSRLLKKQHVECVKGSPGQRDSLYMRSGEKKIAETPLR
jgi:hypothetical protein